MVGTIPETTTIVAAFSGEQRIGCRVGATTSGAESAERCSKRIKRHQNRTGYICPIHCVPLSFWQERLPCSFEGVPPEALAGTSLVDLPALWVY